jgi:hypothetical protein
LGLNDIVALDKVRRYHCCVTLLTIQILYPFYLTLLNRSIFGCLCTSPSRAPSVLEIPYLRRPFETTATG